MKDPWAKPKGGRIQCGKGGWVGQRKVLVGKWRQLYSNINKKFLNKKIFQRNYKRGN